MADQFDNPNTVADQAPFVQVSGFYGAALIAPGAPVVAQRAIMYICTTAGTVTLTMQDGSTLALPLLITGGPVILPLSITEVVLGAAVATFWALK